MPWRFDPFIVDIVWLPPGKPLSDLGDINMGTVGESDLFIDTGDRTNDSSDIDQGLRILDDGNI